MSVVMFLIISHILAPEVIKGTGYDENIDYWSIGIILYILLCGFPPFFDDDSNKLFEIISRGKFEFPSPYWDDISDLGNVLRE
jgi:calcium/calmodulin-dependent protein kinase I